MPLFNFFYLGKHVVLHNSSLNTSQKIIESALCNCGSGDKILQELSSVTAPVLNEHIREFLALASQMEFLTQLLRVSLPMPKQFISIFYVLDFCFYLDLGNVSNASLKELLFLLFQESTTTVFSQQEVQSHQNDKFGKLGELVGLIQNVHRNRQLRQNQLANLPFLSPNEIAAMGFHQL